ncbi:hypothetical protein BELL_1778g00010 [Botrytis elliptica]|uniref:Carboxylic ester hydrolase n=1 Tax=Botrytis elliptica TaxID=278938 RepID=A0A4Z1HPP9_9HELO|nr:hypothetical protein BELL_1778g00010 [Botrytis elliptica]
MKSTLSIFGLPGNFAVAYDFSVSAIATLLPAKSIVFYATHNDAGVTFTSPADYNAGGGPPVMLAVMAWKESDTVPTDIIATKYVNDTNPKGGVLRQRPLCAYPSKAVYDGTGDVNAPENWSCKAA